MKNSRLILLLTASFLMVSCDQKEFIVNDRPVTPAAGVPLRLGSSINKGITRAFDTTWEANNEIGVFTTVAGSSSTTPDITMSGTQKDENIAYKIAAQENTYNSSTDTYTYSSFSPSAAGSQIYLPVDGSRVDVYAYYPYNSSVSATTPLSITVPATQTQSEQKKIDVLKAKVVTTSSAPIDIDHATVQLQFEHAMSKVVVYVMAGNGFGDSDLEGDKISSVQLLSQPTTATFAPISQTLTITNNPENTITMQEVTAGDPDYRTTYEIESTQKDVVRVYRAIILPNDNTTNPVTTGTQRQIKFNVGSTYYTYNIIQAFTPGSQTVFAMRLSAEGLDVRASIMEWTHVAITPDPLYPQPQQ